MEKIIPNSIMELKNVLRFLSEAADIAEDAVHVCERLRLDSLTTHFTLNDFEVALNACHRLHEATLRLTPLIEGGERELRQIADEQSSNRFGIYADDAIRRWNVFEPLSKGVRTAAGEHSSRTSGKGKVWANMLEIFRAQPNLRTKTLRRELSHSQMMRWCIAFPPSTWSEKVVSRGFSTSLIKWIKEQSMPDLSPFYLNNVFAKVKDMRQLEAHFDVLHWLQTHELVDLSSD